MLWKEEVRMPVAPQKVILVVDDSENDLGLLLRAFKIAAVTSPLQTVTNGEDAICYLKGEGRFSNRELYPMPALMLLDLKMPGTDGLEVLRWARSKHALDSLSIVVLTTSENLDDLKTAYELGANSFLSKPLLGDELSEMVRALHHYWIVSNRSVDQRGFVH
jgi:CheY-like chemotaxis protein